MKNGGLMKNSRKNEPNKLPIFGAHQVAGYGLQIIHILLRGSVENATR